MATRRRDELVTWRRQVGSGIPGSVITGKARFPTRVRGVVLGGIASLRRSESWRVCTSWRDDESMQPRPSSCPSQALLEVWHRGGARDAPAQLWGVDHGPPSDVGGQCG